MAAAAVALAVIATSDGGGGPSPINTDDVRQQIDELKQFLREQSGQ